MKILHSADWHLGAKNLKLPIRQQQLLKDEIMDSVQELFRKAYREDYDAVLICGDLFHSKSFPQKSLNLLMSYIEEFSRPVIYVVGNHDSNFLLPENLPNNFIFLNKNNPKFAYQNVNFFGAVDGVEINPDEINILLLHGNIENTRDNDYVNINNYLTHSFDYIALGHIHQFKKYKKGEKIFAYSGSLFSNGFDECGEKGFLEFVIEDKKIEKLAFSPFASRKYMICECDITDLKDSHQIINLIKENLKKNDIAQSDLVRVVLTGSFDENTDKAIEYIGSQFEKNYFYFEIVDKSSIRLDFEKIKNEKLSFKYEFISLVENSELSEDDKKKICEIGLEALKGEGLRI